MTPSSKFALSLKSKTRLICAGMLVCFALLGGIAINRAAVINHQTSLISTLWAPRSRLAQQLGEAARDYRISESLRILSITPDMAEHADSDLKDNAELFQGKLSDYRKRLKPGESAAPLDNIAKLWGGYVQGNEQMLALSRDAKTAEASDRFRNSASKFYLVSGAISDLSDAAMTQETRASATADEIYRQSRNVMIGALAAVAILAFLAALFFEVKVWRVLVRLSGVMQRLARGDFEAEVAGTHRHDEIGEMSRAVQVFKDNGLEVRRLEAVAEAQRLAAEDDRRKNDELRSAAEEERRKHDDLRAAAEVERAQVVESIGAGLAELSSGNLTFRLTDEFAPEFRKLHADFNAAMENLQETMKVISFGAVGIHSSTQEISQASDKLARRTEKQAASLEETAAALEQVTTTVKTSAVSAQQAKAAVASAKTHAERSDQVVRNAVSAMGEIERSARQISDIIGVMDEIAFQTNLLALNAGVEAARAGEAGKGFAVVASEVRALAQRSTVAAKEIKALISSSSQHVGAGVALVGETGKALELIAAQVNEINGAIGDIAAAAEDQANGLLQINMSVSQMDKVTQQNAAMAEESTAASHTLTQEANELARLIGRFQLGAAEQVIAQRGSAPVRPGQPPQRAQTILRSLSSGSAALAVKLEDAVAEDWEEF